MSPALWRVTLLFLLFNHQVVSNSLQPCGLQHARLSCPLLSPGVCSNSCPLSQWCHPTISSSVTLFSCTQSFLASGSFPTSRLFASGGPSIRAVASGLVLSMNIQDWLSSGLTGWSPCCPRNSRVFSSTTIQKHQLYTHSLLYGPTLISLHDYWKNHSFYQMDICWQSDVSAFSYAV